jgi:hypothetical protein
MRHGRPSVGVALWDRLEREVAQWNEKYSGLQLLWIPAGEKVQIPGKGLLGQKNISVIKLFNSDGKRILRGGDNKPFENLLAQPLGGSQHICFYSSLKDFFENTFDSERIDNEMPEPFENMNSHILMEEDEDVERVIRAIGGVADVGGFDGILETHQTR